MTSPRGTDVTGFKRVYRGVNAGAFPQRLELVLNREAELRYGENPNQPAAVFRFGGTSLPELTNIRMVKDGKGGMSATNFMDVARGMDILKFFSAPAVSVMKHCIPSGFAVENGGEGLADVYVKSRDADARSAFGSVVVFNRPIDTTTAQVITSSYVEGVAAPEFEPGVMEIFDGKKDLRVIQFSNLDKLPRFVGDDVSDLYDMKVLPTGRVIVQRPYLTSIRSAGDLISDPMVKHEGRESVVQKDPNQQELRDMVTAWYVNFGVRSNGIVIVKDGVTLAIGSGQQERVGAVEQAIAKAYMKAMDREGIKYDPLNWRCTANEKLSTNPLKGAVVSSDAFFPFRDSVDLLGECGVSAVIQPGGSIRDHEVIDAVNERGMAMAFTLERCFGHF